MTIQVNAQTQDGVWGYMISVLDAQLAIVTSQWFRTLPALPNGDAGPKEGT